MGRNSGPFDRDGYAKILDKYKAAILPETSSTTPSPKCIGLASFQWHDLILNRITLAKEAI